ncbi:hypothetical protein GCM10023085_04710 [Actinomadura viridis]|uniref:Adhesin domain-containing protein n=1 Tax=Actinomadura viridis TaxID=58110 RepID=A0A931DMI7_9ACTN|nr:DUF4097 family beta strand repeat-containing protein [Actinomadura viridis]MBG6091288.1 hypothetical protein [Actinomadura viridis]
MRDAPPGGAPAAGAPAAGAPDARPRRRGIWVMLAIATALAVLLPAGFRVWGAAVRRTVTESAEFRRPVTEVEIDAGSARVTLGPGQAGRVRIVKTLTWTLSEPRVEQIWAGELLLVRVSCEGPRRWYHGGECDADIDLRIPPLIRVRATAGSGEVRVRGIGGDLRLETGSGRVHLADVRGRVWARARSGLITGTGLTSYTLEATVESGRLAFDFERPPRHVKLSAGSGAGRVTVPRGSYYRVELETGSGAVRVDPALNDRSSLRGIVGKVGSGALSIGYPGAR